jgi:antitoxin VapB
MHKAAEPTVAYRLKPEPGATPVAERQVRLFRNGANQAVRIPKEFELPGQSAVMRREGDRLIIEAVKPVHPKGSPAALLAALEQWAAEGPIDEDFPDVDEGLLPLDDIILGEPEQ